MNALPANGGFGGLDEAEIREIEADVTEAVRHLLGALRIAPDHNTEDTPARVARMMVRETFAGRYQAAPKLTVFPNVRSVDQVYAVGPIKVHSCCAHHLVPIIGQAWVGLLPGEYLIGLSKLHRLTRWIMARPQIQEEATGQLADALESALRPRGLAVILRCHHFCCSWRGVQDGDSEMTTSVMRGLMLDGPAARSEFMALIGGMGFG